TGVWSNLAGNPTTATFSNSSDPKAVLSGLSFGTYKFVWSVSNAYCTGATDTVELVIDSISNANAGEDSTLCGAITYTMTATPLSGSSVGTWTQIDANPAVTFTNSNSNTSGISGLVPNDYVFVWTVTNGTCPSVSDTVRISIYETPQALTGVDQTLCEATSANVSSRWIPSKMYHTFTWSFDAGKSNVTSVPTIVTPNAPNTTINTLDTGIYYFVLEVSNLGCISVTDTVKIEIVSNPIVDFDVDDSTVCLNVCNNFTNLSTINDPSGSVISNYTWTFGDGQNSTSNDPTHCYNEVGDYTVKLYAVSNYGCIDSMVKTNYISVNPLPIAGFEVGPDELTPEAQTIFTDLSIGALTYLYDFGNGSTSTNPNPIYNYPVEGTYTVKQLVTNEFGCKDSVERIINVLDKENVFIPNAFTPDNDGFNEVFMPVFSSVDSDNYSFKIFNRWGEIMFETTDITEGWDGTHNGVKVPTGTYVWRITYKQLNGLKVESKNGHVTLLN
ncbi:MAG: PKD domain-containing protein, partial [Flavobacteriales bacterium]